MKKNHPVLVLSLMFALTLRLSSPVFAGALEDHITKGGQFVKEKDYKKAIKEYETALSANPKSAKANLLLGLTWAALGDSDKAIRYSSAAVSIEPSYASYSNLGLVYAYKADYEKAAENYEKALKISPKSYQGWYQLGKVYFTEGNFSKAIEAYTHAVKENSQFSDAYQGLGSAYYWSGDTESALKQVSELKRLKLNDKAEQLQNWISDKEDKKKQSSAPAPATPKI